MTLLPVPESGKERKEPEKNNSEKPTASREVDPAPSPQEAPLVAALRLRWSSTRARRKRFSRNTIKTIANC